MSDVKTDSTPLEKIVNEVLSIRNNLKKDSTKEGELPEDIERGGIYSLANLYAEHAAMFEILSKRLLNTKIKILGNNEEKKEIKEVLDNDKIKKEHIDKLKEIRGKLDNSNEEDKKIIKLIDEVLKLKEIKKHIAGNRLRASNKDKENLRVAAKRRDGYMDSDDLNNFQGIPNSIQITDIHNDMYHFLLGMTEPITINGSTEPAFTIDSQNPIITTKEGYKYPNLVYNPKFTGTITFGGDLIQSHDSGVDDNLGAIPLCLAMKHCMEEANKNGKKIIYVAGNHELEALNEGQHPEVRTIMRDMFKEGLIEYCHYDRNPKPNGTFISHTKLNKPLVEVILNNLTDTEAEEYKSLFTTEETDKGKQTKKLKEIKNPEQREQLAKLLNENFARHFEISKEALFSKGPEGISDFVIVGEELERTYFRGKDKCAEARNTIINKDLEKLKALKIAALVLSENKKELEIDNFADLKEKFENFKGRTYSAYLKNSEGIKDPNNNDKVKEEECKVEINQNDGTISVTKDGTAIGTFALDGLGSSFVTAITSNQNSRPYSLMNRGALLNFSGGLHGYDDKEKDYTEEALDLGCNHIVGHRPTLLDPEGRYGSRDFTSLNVPIAIKMGNEITLQTDYNGKNEDKYVNCRITKFDGDGRPHLVGISKMSEEHREFFKEMMKTDIDSDIENLYKLIYNEDANETKITKFISYFKSNPLPVLSENQGQEENKELKKYFEEFGKQHGLDFQKSKLDETLENFNFVKEYQKIFSENRKRIIEKQDNIQKKSQKQSIKTIGGE